MDQVATETKMNLPQRVLLAEQNDALRKSQVKQMQGLKWQVIEAHHGGHAWRLLQSVKVDLVMAGWSMPEISGVGLLKVVRSHPELSDLPVILMVGFITKEQVLEAGQAGVSGIIVLPVSTKSLIAKLSAIIDEGASIEKQAVQEAFSKGLAAMERGDYDQALSSFKQVLSTYQNAEVYFNLGYIKTAQERYDEALVYFRRATEIDTAFAKAYRLMGDCYKSLDKPELAEGCYQTAANIYMERENDQVAEEMLKKVLELNPETINVFNSLGILYRRQGEPEKAAEQYQRALKVNPRDENIHFNLARLYFEIGDLKKAESILHRAVELAPGFTEAKELLTAVKRRRQKDSKKSAKAK